MELVFYPAAAGKTISEEISWSCNQMPHVGKEQLSPTELVTITEQSFNHYTTINYTQSQSLYRLTVVQDGSQFTPLYIHYDNISTHYVSLTACKWLHEVLVYFTYLTVLVLWFIE